LINRVDPDVVVVQVTQWNPKAIRTLAPATIPAVQQQSLQASLVAGLNLLRTRGAPIVWSPDQLDARTLGVLENPFYGAMDELTGSSTLLRSEGTGKDPSQLVDQLRAVRRRSSGELTRVLVVGDSVSRTLGYGLEHWAESTDSAVVWSVGTGACGIADQGNVVSADGRVVPELRRCHEVQQGWVSQVQQFKPDLVIVLSSIWDNQQRQLSTWPRMLVPGDPAFDDYLVQAYTAAYDIFAAHGAKVLWMKSPCAHPGLGPWPHDSRGNPEGTNRIRHVNDVVLPRVARARPALRFFDLFSVVCPDGRFEKDVGGVRDFRPDGMHFSPDASIWIADHYGKKMLETGLH
jgi:hypothetical protein